MVSNGSRASRNVANEPKRMDQSFEKGVKENEDDQDDKKSSISFILDHKDLR
jgi:hypothetical protein